MTTGAVRDDAHPNHDHADDTEQVGGVLRAEPVVPGVVAGHQVHDYVHDTGHHHQQQSGAAHAGELAELLDRSAHRFYRQHMLVIHHGRLRVNLYRQFWLVIDSAHAKPEG